MAILGPMLIFAGIELAKAARDTLSNRHDFIIVLVIAIFVLGINTIAGFLIDCASIAVSYLYRKSNLFQITSI